MTDRITQTAIEHLIAIKESEHQDNSLLFDFFETLPYENKVDALAILVDNMTTNTTNTTNSEPTTKIHIQMDGSINTVDAINAICFVVGHDVKEANKIYDELNDQKLPRDGVVIPLRYCDYEAYKFSNVPEDAEDALEHLRLAGFVARLVD